MFPKGIPQSLCSPELEFELELELELIYFT